MTMTMEDLNKQLAELEGGEESRPMEFVDLLKSHLISLQESSKRRNDCETESKMVQADWTMVMETRQTMVDQFAPKKKLRPPSIHSSTPNLSNSAEDDEARMVRSGSSNSSTGSTPKDNQSQKCPNSQLANRSRRKMLEMAIQREDNLAAHLRDYRFRSENLHRMLALKDNNTKRLEDEICRLKELMVESKGKEKEMLSLISDMRLNLSDLEAQYDEDMTLCQLKEAEHKYAMDQLTESNKQLAKQNKKLNLEIAKMTTYKPSSITNLTDENIERSLLTSNQQSRSYDALSTSLQQNGGHFEMHLNHLQADDDSKAVPASSKPTDQKVFLNGRIILSHSTNLQQIFRNHADFFNACKSNEKPFVTSKSADECRQNENAKAHSNAEVDALNGNKSKLFQSQQHLQYSQPPQQQPRQQSKQPQQLNNPQLSKQQNKQQHINQTHPQQQHLKQNQQHNPQQHQQQNHQEPHHPLQQKSDQKKQPNQKSNKIEKSHAVKQNSPITQSNTHQPNQPTSQSISQSISHSTGQSISHSTGQSISHSTSQTTNKLTNIKNISRSHSKINLRETKEETPKSKKKLLEAKVNF